MVFSAYCVAKRLACEVNDRIALFEWSEYAVKRSGIAFLCENDGIAEPFPYEQIEQLKKGFGV